MITINATESLLCNKDGVINGSASFNYFSFISKLARNASRELHGRNRRANDDPTSVSTAPPTLDSFSNDDDNEDNDDSEEDDDFWEDEDSREFQDPSKKDPLFLKSEHMSVLMAMEDEGILSTMGHRFEDMVLSCTYRGVSCR